LLGEFKFELELVHPFWESTFAAENSLVLEQWRKAISKVFSTSSASPRTEKSALSDKPIALCYRMFINFDESMQTDRKMCYPKRFYNSHNDRSFDYLSRKIRLPRVLEFDDEFGDVSRARRERGSDFGE
jgi:hypothetical protein